jgi:hypothetical protein
LSSHCVIGIRSNAAARRNDAVGNMNLVLGNDS